MQSKLAIILKMKKLISIILIISFLAGCSTTGGWYSKDDPSNNEFSIVNSALGVVGAAAAVVGIAAAANGGGGNSFAQSGYAWDYQPGNAQWVCRNKANGQYAYSSNCRGMPYIDNWP